MIHITYNKRSDCIKPLIIHINKLNKESKRNEVIESIKDNNETISKYYTYTEELTEAANDLITDEDDPSYDEDRNYKAYKTLSNRNNLIMLLIHYWYISSNDIYSTYKLPFNYEEFVDIYLAEDDSDNYTFHYLLIEYQHEKKYKNIIELIEKYFISFPEYIENYYYYDFYYDALNKLNLIDKLIYFVNKVLKKSKESVKVAIIEDRKDEYLKTLQGFSKFKEIEEFRRIYKYYVPISSDIKSFNIKESNKNKIENINKDNRNVNFDDSSTHTMSELFSSSDVKRIKEQMKEIRIKEESKESKFSIKNRLKRLFK